MILCLSEFGNTANWDKKKFRINLLSSIHLPTLFMVNNLITFMGLTQGIPLLNLFLTET